MIAYLSKGFYDNSVLYQPLPIEDAEDKSNFSELDDQEFSTKSINRFSPQSTKQSKEEIYLLEIKEGQTIQSISLKYNISLWELNRLNNLISSQDFYSLKEIKIPSTEDSYRSELLKSDGARLSSDKQFIENGTIDKQPRKIAFNDIELNGRITDFTPPSSSVSTILNSPSFDANNFVISQSKKQAQNLFCGLKWIQIICILFLCLFVIPFIIIISFLLYK